MAGRGAIAFAIDTKADAIEKARAKTPGSGATYQVAPAEDMPFEDGFFDIVIVTNSLHHVAPPLMDRALAEAKRVLKPGGTLVVSDPLPEGPRYELTRLIDDEKPERIAAWAAVDRAATGMTVERELDFIDERAFEDFDSFRRNVCRNDKRIGAFAANEDAMRHNFANLGFERDGVRYFDQPVRVRVLRKAA
jgi:SAM-dependent methyltransferase